MGPYVPTQAAKIMMRAAELRRFAEQTVPAFSTRKIIEANFPNILVTGGALPPGVDEVMQRTDDGPIIVYSRSLSCPAQRFAIAHGVAHVIFDGHREACRAGVGCDVFAERRADEFATELLVPIALLAACVTRFPSDDACEHELYLDQVDEIAGRFNVPQWVIDKRIRTLAVV